MSLHDELDRLSLTEPTDVPQCVPGPSALDQGGAVGSEPCMDTDRSAHTPDPCSLRKFVSSSSLFEGEQHLFEFIDEPVSKSWPSPPSDLDRFSSQMRDSAEQEDGTTVRDKREGDDPNLSASYNFLDDVSGDGSVTSEKSTVEKGDQEPDEGNRDEAKTPPSTGRSAKGRAPPPPTSQSAPDSCPPDCHMRGSSFTDGSGNWQYSIPVPHKTHYHICPEFRTYNYMAYPGSKVRFYQVGYNTNLKKPPENWARMKGRYHARGGESARKTQHTSHSYSHIYGYDNWLSYAFFTPAPVQNMKKYSVPSSWKSRKQFLSHLSVKGQAGMHNFDNSLCMCCKLNDSFNHLANVLLPLFNVLKVLAATVQRLIRLHAAAATTAFT